MMELTKELLKKVIKYPASEASSALVSEMARQLLASMEQEPVAYIGKTMLDDIVSGGRCCGRVWAGDEDKLSGESITPLYAAPQLPHPAVPECFTNSVSALESLYRNGQKQNWNERYTKDMAYASGVLRACRAAMLQGADDSLTHEGKNHPEDKLGMVNHLGDANEKGNSPVIPDGWQLVPVELTGAMTNAMTDAILDDLHNVDVWRSVLAAAPRQEAE